MSSVAKREGHWDYKAGDRVRVLTWEELSNRAFGLLGEKHRTQIAMDEFYCMSRKIWEKLPRYATLGLSPGSRRNWHVSDVQSVGSIDRWEVPALGLWPADDPSGPGAKVVVEGRGVYSIVMPSVESPSFPCSGTSIIEMPYGTTTCHGRLGFWSVRTTLAALVEPHLTEFDEIAKRHAYKAYRDGQASAMVRALGVPFGHLDSSIQTHELATALDRHKQPVCRCATLRVVTAGVESGRARCDACGQMWASMDAPIRWLGSGLNSLILLRGPDNQAEILEYVGGPCRSSKELFIDDMIGPDKQLYIWRDKPELGVFYRLLMVAPRPKATPW